MTATPLVSVIIPTYNATRTLSLCIESVQRQGYPNKEIIVVDDCSTDGTADLARSFEGVRLVGTGTNGGVSKARNVGVAHAKGAILMFLDSDVAMGAGSIEESVRLLVAEPSIGAVCGMYEQTPLIRDSLFEECRCLQAYYWRKSSEGSVSVLIPAISAMRAEVFQRVGPFNTRLRHTEEVDYGQRLSQQYEIRLTSKVRGTHDDDDKLLPFIRKIFIRGRLRVPLYARRRKFSKGFETASRSLASVLSLLAVLLLAVPAVLGPLGWLLPVAALAGVLACDFGMYAFVARSRSLPFFLTFVGVQLVFNLTVAVSVAVGAAHWVVSPAFRRLYDRDEAIVAAPADMATAKP